MPSLRLLVLATIGASLGENPPASPPRAEIFAPNVISTRDYERDGKWTHAFLLERARFALEPIGHRLDYRELTSPPRSTLNGSGNIYTLNADVLNAFRPAP